MTVSPSLGLVARLLIPFGLGYFLSYLYRTVNAVIAPDLAGELGLGAGDLGLLTSTYLLTFAAAQLPLGILLDRFGPRRIEAVLLAVAAGGAVIFATAQGLGGLMIGRALIGFGVSACLMAAFTAFVAWFPAPQLPRIYGFQMAAGGLGALTATTPVYWALQATDWRGLFLLMALLTLLVAALLVLVAPNDKRETRSLGFFEALRSVAEVYCAPRFLRIAPLAVISQAGFLVFQGLWMGPWLRDVAGLSDSTAAFYLFLVAGAMVLGYLSLGTLTERITRVGPSTMSIAVIGMSVFAAVQLGFIFPVEGAVLPLCLAFGFIGTIGMIPYAALSQSFPGHLAGRVNTALNMLVFIAAFAGQWGVGELVDLWPENPTGGYGAQGFRAAFSLFVALQALGVVWYLIAPRR